MTGPGFPRIPLSHLSPAGEPEHRYRLMELVRRQSQARRYSVRTQDAYVQWIRRYIIYHDRRHPRELGAEQVRQFLSHLAVEGCVAASTQNQALAALVFLYDGVLKQPLPRVEGTIPGHVSRHVPVVLSPSELRALFAVLRSPHRLCAHLMYGSGLRVSECMSLRMKDVDLDLGEIVVRGGKGDKDRRTPLARSSFADLRRWIDGQCALYAADVRAHVQTDGLPGALERKYPNAAGEWRWRYVFPAMRSYADSSGQRRSDTCARALRAVRRSTRVRARPLRTARTGDRSIAGDRRSSTAPAECDGPCRPSRRGPRFHPARGRRPSS